MDIYNSFGKSVELAEKDFHGFTALCGSSPAYIFMLIEAMADAAVCAGMPRAQAYEMAAQAVMGSAKMVLETGVHREQLKDNVCSPGGTTIAAVCELENRGFKSTVQAGIDACVERNNQMKK